MSNTPPPNNQTIYFVDKVGNVPVSAAGLDSTNWPHTWGNPPPDHDPLTPATISEFAEHMGYHLTPLFTALNTALGAADMDFKHGQHPPGWVALQNAMKALNKFLDSSEGEPIQIHLAKALAMPFVASFDKGNSISLPNAFTGSYGSSNYAGNLHIHVDVEPMGADYGSWQIVTGYEIEIWTVDVPKAREKKPRGGSSSSSAYYASSSSSPVGGH